MRRHPGTLRQSRPSPRKAPVVQGRGYRPSLVPLESRVLPGDTLFGMLLAHGLVSERALLPRVDSHGHGRAALSVVPAEARPLAAVPVSRLTRDDTTVNRLAANATETYSFTSDRLFTGEPFAGVFAASTQPGHSLRLSVPDSLVTAGIPVGAVAQTSGSIPEARPLGTANPLVAASDPSSGERLLLGLLQGGPSTAGPPAAPSHLGVTAWSATQNDLIWEDNSANETGFRVERSTNGFFYEPVATVEPDVTTYSDTSPLEGPNLYRVVSLLGDVSSAPSNVLRIDPDAVPMTFDRSGGFADTTGISINGSATYNGPSRLVRLTDGAKSQAGTVFATDRVGITSFTTTFTFQIHGGSDPRADGMAFIIQANNPSAVGPGGGGLAYGPDQPGCCGLLNSAAVKFDVYSNAGEGTNSTGLFTEGRSPTARAGNAPRIAPDRSDSLPTADIDLRSGRIMEATIEYDGTALRTTLRDTVTNGTAVRTYAVNLSRFVSANTAWVGFGGGTGGLTAIQDIQTWQFNALETPILPPFAASHLGLTAASPKQIDLLWEDNSTNETGFRVERADNDTDFKPLADLKPDSTTFSDTSPLEGVNYYRVVAFSDGGDASPTNVLRVDPAPKAALLDRSTGFDDTSELRVNGSTSYDAVGRLVRLTGAANDQAGSFFWTERVGIGSFTTSFTFQIHGGSDPRADGMAFIIQANSPTALGPSGGGLGYGPDQPGCCGILNSIAVKFDIYNNAGEGTNSTGLFTGGRSPTMRLAGLPAFVPDVSVSLPVADIDLNSGRMFEADLFYEGTTFAVILTDLVSGGQAFQAYKVNLTRFLGANTAWVGFGGGTGGLTALQDIRAWSYSTP